jgi:hypothetical protein
MIARADGGDPEPLELNPERVVDPVQPDWAAAKRRR